MTSSSILSKVTHLKKVRHVNTALRRDMNKLTDERREDQRTSSDERLFVQIVASQESDLVGTTVSCNALDVSASGLRIESRALIPEGSKLDIWVDVRNKPGKFFLSSDVKWSKSLDDGSCEIGVELLEGATTDLNQWQAIH
ncbi:MAG: hypothetical protein ACI9FB_004318 [Candidatus Azotimanducaceae bacterium]|jgi:hypothetical protein